MEQTGYSLVHNGAEVQCWGDVAGVLMGPPDKIVLPNGDHVHCPAVGVDYSGYRLVERWLQYDGTDSIEFDGAKVVVTRPTPTPAQLPPRMVAAAFNMTVENGDITNIEGAFNLVAALYLDVGQYMLLFLAPEPDAQYFAQVSGGAPCMSVAERATDYLMIESRAAIGGEFVDPARFDVQVYRI